MELSFELITVLFFVAAFAGFIDAAAGGGGLITIPALMLTGITPVQALGTNKFQAFFGSFSASLHFIRQGIVKPLAIYPMIITVGLAAGSGAYLVQQVDAQLLFKFMPAVFIAIALYSFFSKGLGDGAGRQRIQPNQYSMTAAPVIGFYDGFAGPGTGTFFALSMVKLLGMDFVRATAHAKVLNFTTNISSFLVFFAGGEVIWLLGLSMAMGQFVGGRLGAKMVIKQGAGFIRGLTVVICIAISVGLLLRA
ncbi:MAG: putative membrane protein YfcA [Oceanicoccus sp.]|jgi:uncharacterized membrane protein YfcA